ncbi:MAG: TetR/AcrR family transcriptional regulator [Chloroflexota bacterium]
MPSRPGAPTRRRILLAATELIADVGWGGVTTRLVAERSGANSALVHYYFGSKAALLTEAATVTLTGEFQAAVETIVRARSLTDGFISVLDQLGAYDTDSRQGRLVMEVMAQSLREPGLRQAMIDLLRNTRMQLSTRAAAEMPTTVDPVGASILLAALLDGIGLHRMLDPALDLARATAVLRAVAKRGIDHADDR